MLNSLRDKFEGTYPGEEGTTPVTTACPEAGNKKGEINKEKNVLLQLVKRPVGR